MDYASKVKHTQEPTERPADSALSASAGSVPSHVQKQMDIVGAFFDKHNADEIQWDALDALREAFVQVLGHAETQRKCKLAAHERLDEAYDYFFSQNAEL